MEKSTFKLYFPSKQSTFNVYLTAIPELFDTSRLIAYDSGL